MAKKLDSLSLSILVLLATAVFIGRIGIIRGMIESDVEKPELIKHLKGWQLNRDIPLNEDILNALGTRGAVLGEYVNDAGEKVWLYILKSSGRRSSIHQPEYCYIGSGKNELLKKGKTFIQPDSKEDIPINYLYIQTEQGFQVVLYFYATGDFIGSNYYAQQLIFLLNRLKNEPVGASLVRISKFSKDGNFKQDLLLLQHIAEQIVKVITTEKQKSFKNF